MNIKLYTLYFIVALSATTALQAMRLNGMHSLLSKRALQKAAMMTQGKTLAHMQLNHNEREQSHDESRGQNSNHYIPNAVAIGLAIGLGLTMHSALETEAAEQNETTQCQQPISVDRLDITNVDSVIEALQQVPESDKRIIAQRIAQKINQYSVKDIIIILQHTVNNPHRLLVNALAKKITSYKTQEIAEILKQDTRAYTHEMIARALKNNYNFFLYHTFGGYAYMSKNNGLDQYAEAIYALQEQYRFIPLQALAEDLSTNEQDSRFRMLFWNDQHEGNALDTTKKLVAMAVAQNLNKFGILQQRVENFHRSLLAYVYYWVGTEENKAIIAKALDEQIDLLFGKQKLSGQSIAHIKANALLAWPYIITMINSKYKKAFYQALQHEESVANKAAVFYHSQKGRIYWLELLFTKLWEQKYHQQASNYLFTRFPHDQSEFSNAVLQLYGNEKRIELLQRGRNFGHDELRPYLLFANYAFFANADHWSSCSPHYTLFNFSVGDPNITTTSIIDKFIDQAAYKKYASELQKLEQEFKEIVPNSVFLQFIIPFEIVNDCVYSAGPSGYKKKKKINNKETDDVQSIVKTLKTAPNTIESSDYIEFCLIMTPDTLHTLREQGAEVRVYGDFDQEKLNELTAKLEALVARIANDNPKQFAGKFTPSQSYQAFKPILDDLVKHKD